MRVYPKPGLRVRGPDGRVLPAEGLDVKDTDFFWARRLRDGDVVTTPPTNNNASSAVVSRSGSSE